MSAGKGDKWRQTDFNRYYNSPLWDNLKKKQNISVEEKNGTSIISHDARCDKSKHERDNPSR